MKVVHGQRAERGEPVDGPALAEFLDRAIDFCKQMKSTCPRILLMPLKKFQRSEGKPAREVIVRAQNLSLGAHKRTD